MNQSKKSTLMIAAFALAVGLAGGYTAKAVEPAPVLYKGDLKYFQCVDTASQETVYERDKVQEVANEGDQWLLQLDYGLESFIQSPGEVCVVKRSLSNDAADLAAP